ncbi:hypothetical protein SLS55_005922 [Diplodia seriata]|uniref:Uncharacterized protein n=1 Tax=Diplodia seriata TaxID=420778 RepID=A0ABR3CIV0_9PEZI
MATRPDLTLPPTAPVERYRDEPMELRPVAVYTLVDLTDTELEELRRVCESECVGSEPGDNVRLAPQPRFVGSPLRAVYDSHLELGPQRTFDPIYFIAAVDTDWRRKGVLLVTLDDGNFDEPGCKTDSLLVKPEDSGLVFVNLQIGNSDWEEEKESYGLPTGDDDDDDNGDDSSHEQPAAPDNGDDDDYDSGPECPDHLEHIENYVPFYAIDSVDPDQLIRNNLEPGVYFKTNPATDYFVRCQAILTPKLDKPTVDTKTLSAPDPDVTADLIAQACALHPARCRKNPWLHKSLLVIADCTDPAEHGFALVQMTWDGITGQGRSKSQLRDIGAQAKRDVQRMPGAAHEGLQQRWFNIKLGVRVWRADHPLIAVFQYQVQEKNPGVGRTLLDPQAKKRKEGDEWLVYAPREVHTHSDEPGEEVQWSFEEAVRRFPWMCRQHRWDENFSRAYFICVDNEQPAEKGVVIARVDWDGEVHRSDKELLALQLRDMTTTMRVPAKEALGIIEAGIKKDTNM